MSWITTNAPATGAGFLPADAFEAQAGGLPALGPAPSMGAGDGFRPTWWGGTGTGGGAADGTEGTTNGMQGQIVSLLQQLVGNVGGMLGGSPYGGQSTTNWEAPGTGWSQSGSNGTGASPGGTTGGWGGPNPAGWNGGNQGGWNGSNQGAWNGSGWRPGGFDGFGGGGTGAAGTATFSNATLSSTGDPHLALSGTLQQPNGTTSQLSDHYDNMSSQRDLLSTRDFGDGFRVSTTASAPSASGVTYNASATATMNGGRDSVTMGPGGAVSVVDGGSAASLGANQSLTLSGGEQVSENASGTVTITEQNANGESLVTTFASNGPGVDVSATASGGVTLGGSLVRNALAASGS
jgi:hypothetical protein